MDSFTDDRLRHLGRHRAADQALRPGPAHRGRHRRRGPPHPDHPVPARGVRPGRGQPVRADPGNGDQLRGAPGSGPQGRPAGRRAAQELRRGPAAAPAATAARGAAADRGTRPARRRGVRRLVQRHAPLPGHRPGGLAARLGHDRTGYAEGVDRIALRDASGDRYLTAGEDGDLRLRPDRRRRRNRQRGRVPRTAPGRTRPSGSTCSTGARGSVALRVAANGRHVSVDDTGQLVANDRPARTAGWSGRPSGWSNGPARRVVALRTSPAHRRADGTSISWDRTAEVERGAGGTASAAAPRRVGGRGQATEFSRSCWSTAWPRRCDGARRRRRRRGGGGQPPAGQRPGDRGPGRPRPAAGPGGAGPGGARGQPAHRARRSPAATRTRSTGPTSTCRRSCGPPTAVRSSATRWPTCCSATPTRPAGSPRPGTVRRRPAGPARLRHHRHRRDLPLLPGHPALPVRARPQLHHVRVPRPDRWPIGGPPAPRRSRSAVTVTNTGTRPATRWSSSTPASAVPGQAARCGSCAASGGSHLAPGSRRGAPSDCRPRKLAFWDVTRGRLVVEAARHQVHGRPFLDRHRAGSYRSLCDGEADPTARRARPAPSRATDYDGLGRGRPCVARERRPAGRRRGSRGRGWISFERGRLRRGLSPRRCAYDGLRTGRQRESEAVTLRLDGRSGWTARSLGRRSCRSPETGTPGPTFRSHALERPGSRISTWSSARPGSG